MDALALRLGEMQAKVVRLDALGSRLVNMAGLEFIGEPELQGRVMEALTGKRHSVAWEHAKRGFSSTRQPCQYSNLTHGLCQALAGNP